MASSAQLKQSTVPVTSRYGARILNGRVNIHKGTDFAFGINSAISAFGSGYVTFAGRGTGPNYERGLYVQIRHAPGIETSYHSLSRMTVKAGQTVNMGDTIGYGGKSAVGATGNHCHVGLWLNTNHVDLERFLTPGQIITITNAGRIIVASNEAGQINNAVIPQEDDTEMIVIKNISNGEHFLIGKGYIHSLAKEHAQLIANVVSTRDEIHQLPDDQFRTVFSANGIPLNFTNPKELHAWNGEDWWSYDLAKERTDAARHAELVALLKAKTA